MLKTFHWISILALIITIPVLLANLIPESDNQKSSSLKKALKDFAEDASLKNASWGFYVSDIKNGKEIISHNANLALIPASTQKVMTTLTALSMLGTDFRFETLLQYDGIIQNQTLEGNIYIKGTGDPTLGAIMMDDSLDIIITFQNWLAELKNLGIEKINGSIIADGSWFDDHMIPPKWMWEDMGNYFGAGAHALTVHENLYSVFFNPGTREGDAASVVKTEPVIPSMTFHNDVSTGPRSSGDRVYIYGSPYSNERWLTGTVPLGQPSFEVKGSIPDPGYFLAQAFKQFLEENGVSINGAALTHRTAPHETLSSSRVLTIRIFSPKLIHIAARTNLRSVNTYAENIIKTMGKVAKNEGSFEAGSQACATFWKENGMDTRGLRIHDGSGLSPYNNITTRQLTEMLVFAARDTNIYEALVSGFPVAAQSGTLARMFHNTPSAGVLKAKSGFLGNVRSYTGYTECRNGNILAFTLIVNNYSGTPLEMRRKMETLMNAITRSRT